MSDQTTAKQPLLLFSGGLDSTYLLYSHASKGEKCEVLYVDGGQNRYKIECEQKARVNICEYLEKNYIRPGMRQHSVTSINMANGTKIAWSQPVSWMVAAMSVVDPKVHSCVEISYVFGDEISTHIDNLIAAWEALWPVVKIGELVPLTFPLRYTHKKEILERLPAPIYNMTWVCESPNKIDGEFVPCEHCASCVTRKVEEYRLKLATGRELIWTPSDTPHHPEAKDHTTSSSSRLTKLLDLPLNETQPELEVEELTCDPE